MVTSRPLTFYQTTIGKKAVMAISGVVLFGFVVGHMIGNLQVYGGPEMLNAYAAALHGLAGPLWVVRFVLLATIGAHIWSALSLQVRNSAARPIGYRVKRDVTTSVAAKTMLYGGVALALFIIYHLLHLTVGVASPSPFNAADVYANVVQGFQFWWLSALYIVAQIMLALHLYHGVWSLFQTLGLSHPRYDRWRRTLGTGLAVIVGAGNISIPVSIWAGIISLT